MRADEFEILEEQAERLTGAVRALMALQRPSQDRLDRALSQFSRVFKYEPDGPARATYHRIYRAIGDPPVGTTLSVPVASLTSEDENAIVSALLELHELLHRNLEAARQASQS